eukprot:364100-Chlamydomonas_euryale.AAC.21
MSQHSNTTQSGGNRMSSMYLLPGQLSDSTLQCSIVERSQAKLVRLTTTAQCNEQEMCGSAMCPSTAFPTLFIIPFGQVWPNVAKPAQAPMCCGTAPAINEYTWTEKCGYLTSVSVHIHSYHAHDRYS